MTTKHTKLALVIIATLAAIYFMLLFMKQPLFQFSPFDKAIMNFYLNYELSTILLSAGMLVLLYLLADRVKLSYLNLRNIDAPMEPVKFMGITANDRWKVLGARMAAIVSIVTAIVVYFQVAGKPFSFRVFPDLVLVLIFAVMNSFTEEVIFRFSYSTIVANEGLPSRIAEFLGAAVFGAVHYFGIAPKGIPGMLMAAFIGWFLAKSINETKGFFWAWLVHFIQDVIILTLLFSTAGLS
ncbi:MAG TPA: CPBP family intramembrane metalloprotease [Bellilinea sp.]|nr:CPBP family intramembrane metalloprotease [Bellilinea sp.]